MIFIEMNNGREVKFHCGETIAMGTISLIANIQADCDELESILSTCKGIKRTNKTVQSWFGDDAKFVMANTFLHT